MNVSCVFCVCLVGVGVLGHRAHTALGVRRGAVDGAVTEVFERFFGRDTFILYCDVLGVQLLVIFGLGVPIFMGLC